MRFSSRADVHHGGAPQVAPGQPLHGRRHGGSEHDGLQESTRDLIKLKTQAGTEQRGDAYLSVFMLPRFKVHGHFLRVFCFICVWFLIGHWDVLQNLLDIRLKAHVNHAICLVQNHVGAAAQDQVAVLQYIDQTARSGDDNLFNKDTKYSLLTLWSLKLCLCLLYFNLKDRIHAYLVSF